MDSVRVHRTSHVDHGAEIGEGTAIWHFCHISSGASIGENCSFGQNCFVAPGVTIGSNVKVQNNVSIYAGTYIEDDVFLGPSCVLTNVSNPRSQINRKGVYERTVIRRGATVGANATIVCGVTLNRYAFVAAGSVVTKDVPDYGFVKGVPSKQDGWMSRHGHHLSKNGETMICPESGLRYRFDCAGRLRCIDLGEGDPLPNEQSVGEKSYREYRIE